MTSFDVRIIRQQVGVAPVNNARIITKPAADLVEANAGTGEEGSEGASHGVGRNPSKPTLGYMEFERTGEVITITIDSMCGFGVKHKWITEAIYLEKCLKSSRQGNCAFLPVLEIHSGGLA